MARLTCDDCGTLNSPHRSTCELCGASLSEEKREQSNASNPLLAPFAWGFAAAALFGFFFLSSAWFSAKYNSPSTRHVSGIELFGALNNPGEHVVSAAIFTAIALVGGFLYTKFVRD
ncbi:MAG: zinc finger Ran-binding domain-containing protein [Myxococcota bacterium]